LEMNSISSPNIEVWTDMMNIEASWFGIIVADLAEMDRLR